MQFYEKLDFLMNITKTSNAALGQKVKLDASHISRLRRGHRNRIKDNTVLEAMADYIARRFTTDFQRKALSEVLSVSATVIDSSELAGYIVKWLSNEYRNDKLAVENFLEGLTKIDIKQESPALAKQTDSVAKYTSDEIAVFYGDKGKREAAIFFLKEVLAQNEPRTLLLFSDEATDWMTTDKEFMLKWAHMMVEILSRGNRMKVIHTVSRDLDEMLCAINQWISLYMSGAIEAYYYPKKRDGVFKRTLFIAPGASAVTSNSVGDMTENSANIFFRNKKAITAIKEEFEGYLNQCKHLMKIFTPKDNDRYFETLMEFENEKSDSIIKTESLSLLTMPEEVSASILLRMGTESKDLAMYQRQRIKIFEKKLKTNVHIEIIPIFDIESVNANKINVAFSDMMNCGHFYYTKEEYLAHLKHMVQLLKTYPNYHINMTEGIQESYYSIYVKEDLGAIISKTSTPPVILAVNETNLTAAFWDYLTDTIGKKEKLSTVKKKEIMLLEEYIKSLKSS